MLNKLIIEGMEYSLEKSTSILHHFNTPMVQFQGHTYYGLAVRCHPPEKPEKNYKILEGQFKDVEPHLWQEEGSELKSCISEGCHIYSVKRLSDGEVFKLGDTCTYGVIRKFTAVEYGMLQVDFANDCGATLESLTKKPARVPLFKTEDGVELFDGDDCWYVSLVSDYNIHRTKARPEILPVPSYFKFFSQERFALDYAALNAHILSLKDMRQYISGYKEYKHLLALVKNKLTGSSHQ